MNTELLINYVLSCSITQIELANYLGITRQSVSKLRKGEYVNLSKETKKKLLNLEGKTENDIYNIFKISKNMNEILNRIVDGDSKYLSEAAEGVGYMYYWITNDKFVDQPKYHTYYFGHMNNFYPRYNQAALFMRDTLDRQRYPLVTYQVDYEKKLILDFCIKEFVEKYSSPLYNVEDVVFPITFKEFMDELEKRIKPSCRFMLYLDYIDDDWGFIVKNIKNHNVTKKEIYDLSRLFNFLDNEQPYYGPLLENVLDQFKVKYDINTLLSDCNVRANKIVEVVNIISLEDLYRLKHDKSSRLFDSHGFKRDNEYIKKERRKLKKGI